METHKPDKLVKAYHDDLWSYFSKHDCRKILDAGCGGGVFGLNKPRKNITVYGVDVRIQAAKEAKKGEKVVIGDVRSLPFSKDSFDGVSANHVIEHIPAQDNLKVMKEFNRVMKDAGLLIVAVPLPSKKFWDTYDHMRPYSLRSLTRLVGDAGFEVITTFFHGMGIPGFGKIKLYSLSYKLRKFLADKLNLWKESVVVICKKVH